MVLRLRGVVVNILSIPEQYIVEPQKPIKDKADRYIRIELKVISDHSGTTNQAQGRFKSLEFSESRHGRNFWL